jgi:hypothetical protein
MKTLLLVLSVVLGGCVSGKVYRHDVGELNAKAGVLEGQVREKDEAIKLYEKIYRETRQIYQGVEGAATAGKDK